MRDEYATPPTMDETMKSMAESAREADMKIAVRAEHTRAQKAGLRITDGEALQAVDHRINSDGVEAVLPRFSNILKRWGGEEVPSDAAKYPMGRKRINTSTLPGQGENVAPEASQGVSEREAMIAAAMSEYSTLTAKFQEAPSVETGTRLEELATFIETHK